MRRAILLSLSALAGPAAAQTSYTIVDLGTLPGSWSSVPMGINNLGDVVGWSNIGNTPPAFLYTDAGGMADLGTLPGTAYSTARGVNDLRHVVGESGTIAYRWTASAGMQNLSGGLWVRPDAINNSGHVAGTFDPDSILSFAPARFTPGTGWTPLTPGQNGRAYDVNEAGQIAGYASSNPIRFTPGTGVQFLPELPTFPLTSAQAINNLGDVAGVMKEANGVNESLYLYTDAAGAQNLGYIGVGVGGMNSRRFIVGKRDVGPDHAFLYTPQGGIQNLNALAQGAPGSSWFLSEAMDINEAGQIAVLAYDNTGGQFRAVRLDPVQPTAATVRVAEGCAAAGPAPALAATDPVLGGVVMFTLAGAAPNMPGVLALSPGGPVSLNLGAGCAVFVDLAAPILFPFSTGGGTGPVFSAAIPAASFYAGLALTAQAAVFGSATPIGADLTNGLLLLLGF